MPDVASIVRDELTTAVPLRIAAVAEAIRQRHATACVAILFYGSCLRMGEAMLARSDSILDFYVLVDDYRTAYPGRRLLATANRWLPPNVFYIEQHVLGRTMRAKYGLMTIDRFAADCEPTSTISAIWARFAQPARLVYAKDEDVRRRTVEACTAAVTTFCHAALALQGETFRMDAMWVVGFRYSYDAELRSERGEERARSIVAADSERYRKVGTALLGHHAAASPEDVCRNPLTPETRRAGRAQWRRWRRRGKSLNLLRLIKAVFTFEGAVDYALWKVERHAGVRPEVSAWERRHPILAAPVLLWRFHRAGAFR